MPAPFDNASAGATAHCNRDAAPGSVRKWLSATNSLRIVIPRIVIPRPAVRPRNLFCISAQQIPRFARNDKHWPGAEHWNLGRRTYNGFRTEPGRNGNSESEIYAAREERRFGMIVPGRPVVFPQSQVDFELRHGCA